MGKNYLPLNDVIVLDVVEALLQLEDYVDAQGVPYTTTLYVKESLRGLGYWATQHEVSSIMDRLADNGSLEWYGSTHGGYRHYTAVTQGTQQAPVPQVATQTKAFTINDVEEVSNPVQGDWNLFSYTNPNLQPIYVKGEVDRNTARAYGEIVLGIKYTDVACSRV